MKNIEIDEEIYQFIVRNTQFIGESASSILRRLLSIEAETQSLSEPTMTQIVQPENIPEPAIADVIETKDINETVFNYVNREELAMQRGAVGRFLLILAALYRGHTTQFSEVLDISGRDRLYFAKSEQELAESGSSTKPRQIPDSPFWVMTNSNTTRKKMMLTKVASSLGYNEDDAEKIRELL